jgi:hypothetical protein
MKMLESFTSSRIHGQSTRSGTNPYVPMAVFSQLLYGGTVNTVGITRHGLEFQEIIAIKSVQAAPYTKLDESVMVLNDTGNFCLRQTIA